MTGPDETEAERAARVKRLRLLYEAGRLEEVLIPPDADVRRLVEDVVSGSSEAERLEEE
jgi:hypothetical protein